MDLFVDDKLISSNVYQSNIFIGTAYRVNLSPGKHTVIVKAFDTIQERVDIFIGLTFMKWVEFELSTELLPNGDYGNMCFITRSQSSPLRLE
jgi:hypothetical protein